MYSYAETYCGVDVGGSGLRVGAVHPTGGSLGSFREPHGSDLSPAAVITHLEDMVRRLYREDQPRGLGVGIAAWVDRDRGSIASAPNLPWINVPLRDELARRFPYVPVTVANDLKAIAWGEYRFGAGRGARALLVVFAGTGVGSAVVDDGRLVLGARGFAGEIGHVRATGAGEGHEGDGAGLVCGCGARGCLEAYAGGRALAARSGGLSAGALEARAQGGDAGARGLLEDAGGRLGRTVGAAVMLSDPDVVVLGGGVWEASAVYRTAALATLRGHVHPTRWGELEVREALLGDGAGVVGAADLCRALAPTG